MNVRSKYEKRMYLLGAVAQRRRRFRVEKEGNRMKRVIIMSLLVAIVGTLGHQVALAQTTMNNYTAYPPFINKSVPPAVMLMMTKDHRLFFKGYNDIVDLDNGKTGGDAAIDTTYKDNIDYVGYFDSKKCYDFGRDWAIIRAPETCTIALKK